MVGNIATRTDSTAIGLAASHRQAPYERRVSMLSLCTRKCVKHADIPRAVALIQFDTIIPTVGMNLVGFQNGLSFRPILVPAIEIAIVLTPTDTKTERNYVFIS